MNREAALAVANAVLYEGWMLYPYRRSALKNRQRWTFGILYPPAYDEVSRGTERSAMYTECLVQAKGSATVRIELRFLHLVRRQVHTAREQFSSMPSPIADCHDEPIERSTELRITLDAPTQPFDFSIDSDPEPAFRSMSQARYGLRGTVKSASETLDNDLWKLKISVENTTALSSDPRDRDSALCASMLSAHMILTVNNGEFPSLLDPPDALRIAAKNCRNVGNFPVLVGTEGDHDMLLCSPIFLYDYPQVAPESAGDFYDATEMDEMLTLRVITLTDQEKNQVRQDDEHARLLLERTEQTAHEQLARTHGAIRRPRPVTEK